MINKKKVVYLLFGPTGVGKSDIISYISKTRRIGLISADSIQVFQGLDIGSAKPSQNELKQYPHFLINILSPFEHFDVSDFINRADVAVDECIKEGRVPIISGGTAYYFKHFIYGLSNVPQCDPNIRNEVNELEKNKGLEYLHEYLSKVDSVSAGRINKNDAYRIKRAVEVFMQTTKPLSSFKLPTTPRDGYVFKIFALLREKEELKNRIKIRLDKMFEMGLVDEINKLKKMNLNLSYQSMNGIGYKEFFMYNDIEQIKQAIYMNSIHYAKRQMTFFRSFETPCIHVKWINLK